MSQTLYTTIRQTETVFFGHIVRRRVLKNIVITEKISEIDGA